MHFKVWKNTPIKIELSLIHLGKSNFFRRYTLFLYSNCTHAVGNLRWEKRLPVVCPFFSPAVRLFAVNVTWETEWQNNDNFFEVGQFPRIEWAGCVQTEQYVHSPADSPLVSVNTVLTSLWECVQTNTPDVWQNTDTERQNKDLSPDEAAPDSENPLCRGWGEAEMDDIKAKSMQFLQEGTVTTA